MLLREKKVDSAPSGREEADETAQSGLSGQLERFLRNTAQPIFVVDGHGTIVFVNSFALSLFGYSERELLGRSVDAIIPNALDDGHSTRLSALLHLSDSDSERTGVEIGGKNKEGRLVHLEASLTMLGAAESNLAVWTVKDATRRKSEADRIRRTEGRLNEAQRIAKIGNWELDIGRDEHWWSDELYRMLEIDPRAQQSSFDLFIERIHPEDREFFRENSERVLRTGKPEVIDVRVVLPSGREIVVQSQGEVTVDAEGRPVRATGTLQDITERKNAEAALLLSESRYKEAQRIAKIGNWEWNLSTHESWWSEELYSILEEDSRTYEASLENFLAKVHPEDRRQIIENTNNVSSNPSAYAPSKIRLELGDGRRKIVEMRVDVRLNSQGQPAMVAGTVRDVTERWELEMLLRESEDRYSGTVELAAIGIAHVDEEGVFIWANQHLCEMLGYTKDELLGLSVKQISHPDDINVTDQARDDLHVGRIESLKMEKRYIHKNGAIIWVRITSAVRRDASGEILYDISAVEDISDRKAAEARVQYLATHDEMTGLPNRVLFNELANRALESAREHDRKCAILFIDLDRFKIVNDSLGHQAGDLLLKEMGGRFREAMRDGDLLARLGGDEFVVLLSDPDRSSTMDIARSILSSTQRPMKIMGQECRVTASIGIASYPEDAWDATSLMKHADMAMYLAKEEGKNNFQFYSAHDAPVAVEHLLLESHLSHALEQNEFTAHYQAKVDLDTGAVKGAEALLRWWNSDLGTVSPAQFIPVAEDTGLIVQIGRWILRTACEQNVAWQRQGLPSIAMAVNLSPRQFKYPHLIDDIAQILAETGLAPELLELEITESMIMHDVDRAVERAKAIKALGVRLAIDDFGTGYSSLSQLKRFPIDTLKIDRSFVRDVPDNAEDRAITEAIVSLAKTLGVTVVAEGVEKARQAEFLRELGCDEMQGFYFSKPCHPDAFTELLTR